MALLQNHIRHVNNQNNQRQYQNDVQKQSKNINKKYVIKM